MPRPKLAACAPFLELAAALSAVALLSGSCTEDLGLVPPEAERAAPDEARVEGAAGRPGSARAALTGAAARAEVATRRAAFGDYVVSGPYAHANLAVYLVHGEDRIKGKSFLTLEEALARKLAVLHETGNVSKLAIENVSLTDEIYVQSGDIVKGGKQDRVIAHDFIVPAKSGRMPIASFCVERGRWSRRGKESATQFLVSNGQLATKGLKLAAKKSGSQSLVWREVLNAQTMISGNLEAEDYQQEFPAPGQEAAVQAGELAQQAEQRLTLTAVNRQRAQTVVMPAQSAESPTSLQLTLENKKVKAAAEKYTKALSTVVEGKDDVVGFAFAINGEANSADIYASRALFRKLWPKLLKAASVEAVAELKKDGKSEKSEKVAHPAAAKLVAEFFTKLDEEGEKVAVSEKEITKRVRMKTKESAEVILFETRDAASPAKAKVIHRNLMRK